VAARHAVNGGAQTTGELINGRRAVICTGADAAYFPLLQGLVRSLAAGRLASRLPVGVLDLGLSAEQTTWLAGQGAQVVVPGWDLDFPGRERAPGHYRAMTARPFLPRYFPGYDLYQWIDADAWVQDDDILTVFFAAAAEGKLAIVAELDRGYWTMYKPPKLWTQNHKAFAWGFGVRVGYRLGRNPILNSGVFALAADAPHWPLWAAAHRRMLQRRRLRPAPSDRFNFFLAEQTALNYVVFADRQPYTLLPATANWFCGKGTPRWSRRRGQMVEPHAPYATLSVIHLAGQGMKERVWQLDALEGGQVSCRLTYEEVAALRSAANQSTVSANPASSR
jgi:hypothetical protein